MKKVSIGKTMMFLSSGIVAIWAAAGLQQIPNLAPFPDPSGLMETNNSNGGPIDTTGPFFQSLGTNGRTCATCHLPADGWTISAAHAQARFDASLGTEPLFRTNDGSVCDHNIQTQTVAERQQAYRLLLERGLIRIALSVPNGAEFEVAAVSNPYACNEFSPLSLYRRPLPAANLRFLSGVMWDGRESSTQTGTTPITFDNDVQALAADLTHQAVDATLGHAQATTPPTPDQQQQIVNFEMAMFLSQAVDRNAGPLDVQGATGGPKGLPGQSFFIGINDPLGQNPFGTPFNPTIFSLFDAWTNLTNAAKASIVRGQTLFNSKSFQITGVGGLNDMTGTCGVCHDTPNVGNHSVAAALNIGISDVTNPLGVDYLPVITLQNLSTGEMIQTTDPGRALVTGQWADIGKFKGPILRGLAARAPYFHNGSAQTLSDVVKFYDTRFSIGFTDQEKTDLAAFLSAL